MAIGCLTGNGKNPPVPGRYGYYSPGSIIPRPPDLLSKPGESAGPVPFAEGILTAGAPLTEVCWKDTTVGEVGVDIILQFDKIHFIDQLVLHQPSASGAPVSGSFSTDSLPDVDGIEGIGHEEPHGLSRIEVFSRCSETNGPSIAGFSGRRGEEVLPEGPIRVNVGVEALELTIRLISFHRDIRLATLEVWGAGVSDPSVFPIPEKIELQEGREFSLRPEASIVIGATASDDTKAAAALLSQKLQDRFGFPIPVEHGGGELPPPCSLVIAAPGEFGSTHLTGLPVPDRSEGYTLRITGETVIILAADLRGLIYGAETFLQLLTDGGPNPAAAPCLVEDAPRLPFRGVHLFLPARNQIDYTKRLIRNLLVPMKLNTIFLELAGAMRFDRRPEISEAWERNNQLAAEGKAPPVPHGEVCGGGWITKEEVKDLVDFARSFGIEVIPEIQSLSHVQYLTMTYPEIAEAPLEDGYPDSYCPLHPESRRIVFDIIDEIVDLLGPIRYLHMGHDEVYTMAECPRCRGKSRDELFAHDVTAIYDYLKTKGVGMMIWADMLQPWQRYAGENAAALIPKDIVMLEFVWYFRTWADTEDHLLKNGFQVIFGNCYSSHFTRYEARTAKPGVIGTQVSVWHGTNEEDMGRLGKLYDLMYSANAAWSAYHQDELRWTFDRKIVSLLPGIRKQLQRPSTLSESPVRCSKPVDLGPYITAPRRDAAGTRGGYDLSALPDEFPDGVILVESLGIRDRIYPEYVDVVIDSTAAALVFGHTSSAMGLIAESIGRREPIARYEILFADNTSEIIDVAYGYHVAEWNRRHGAPLKPRFHRHAGYIATYPVDPLWQGKTAAGEDITIYSMEWENPHPDKTIRAVRIATLDTATGASLLVVGISKITITLDNRIIER